MSNAELIRNLQEAMQSRSRPAPYDATAVVTRVDGTTAWVRLAGSDTETPVKLTIDAKAGDTVQVRVGGGSAWLTGNQSAPPTDDTTAIISKLLAQEADTKAVTAGKTADEAKEEIKAVAADLVVARELIAQKATIEDLNAEKARIDTLDANKANVADLNAATGRIGQLEANALTADSATIKDLQANKANVSDLTAATGRIGQLEADHVSTADLEAVQADIDNLEATKADVAVLEAGYAKIDLANVNTAQITNGVIQTAAIVDEQVFTVTGNKATIKEINADNINVRNLNAKNLKIETADGYIMLGDKKTPTKEFIDSLTNDLNDRIDGAIETFTATAVPTLSNYPANQWKTAEERATHVGDVCYVVNDQIAQNGYCYRFTLNGSTFSWQLIKDSDVTAALARLTTAEGKIGNIEAFDEDIATFKTETEGEISTLQTKTTTLETSLGDKVDKTTFNEVSQKVDENSASITTLETNVAKKADSSTVTTLSNTVNSVSQKADSNEAAISDLTEVVESKADGSTVSTLTQTVNSVKQTADGNSSTITSLTTTLGTNADGTTKAGDIVHRTSAVEQDLSGFKTTVAQTYHKTSDFNTYKTANDSAVAAAKKAGTDAQSSLNSYKTTNDAAVANAKKAGDDAQADLDAYKGTVSETYATKSSVTQTADGIKQEVASTYTTQTTFNNYKSSNDSAVAGVKTTADAAKEAIDGLEIGGRNLAKGTDVRYTNLSGMMYGGKLLASAGIQEGDTITISVDVDADDIEWNTTASQNRIGCSINIPLASGQQYIEVWVGRAISESSNVVKAFTGSFHGRVYKTFVMRAAVTEDRDIYLYAQGIKSGTLSVGNVKFERGNRATDWTPAPEDLEAATTAVASDLETVKTTYVKNSTFETTTEQIRGEVSAVETTAKNYTDGKIATEVSDRNSAITQKADEITSSVSATYATKTSVPTKVSQLTNDSKYATQTEAQGYASTAESNAKADTTNKLKSYSTTSQMNTAISQSASTIEAKITASETSSKEYADGLISTEVTNRNAAITAASDSITASVAETYTTKTDFNALEIGGRNLFKNSKLGTPWVLDTGASRYDADTVQIVAGSGTRRVYQLPSQGYWGIWEANTTYTLSVDAKASADGLRLSMQPQANGVQYKYVDVTTEWKRYSYTFTSGNATATASLTLLCAGSSGTLYLRKPKLEYGNKATDWTPAPEDLEAYADSAVATAKSEIKVTTDGISTEVAKKVGNSEIISKINQSAETVKIQASKVEVDGTLIIGKSTAESVAKTAVDGLQVGGRNLAKGTNVSFTWTSADGNTHLSGTFCGNLLSGTVITVSAQIDAENVTWPASGARRIGCETSIAKTGGGRQYIGVWAGQQVSDGANVVKAFTGSFHGRVSKTFTLAGDWKASDNTPIICYAQNFYGTVSVSNIKIEIGSKATDWSPAPEDVDAGIASASQTASKYITADSTSGIKVHAEANPTTNYAQIDDTGMSIYQGVDGVATEVAEFKASGVRIGKNGQTNINVTPNQVEMTAPNGSPAMIVSYESNTDYTQAIDYGIKITDEHDQSNIKLVPTVTEGDVFDGNLELSSVMARYFWELSNGNSMTLEEGGFSIWGHNSEFFNVDSSGAITVNNQQPLIIYEDVQETVSYSAGTIGTRAAAISLGAAAKSGYRYVGATVLHHSNSSSFWINLVRNANNDNAYAVIYRASDSAVNAMSITVRKMWVHTKVSGEAE